MERNSNYLKKLLLLLVTCLVFTDSSSAQAQQGGEIATHTSSAALVIADDEDPQVDKIYLPWFTANTSPESTLPVNETAPQLDPDINRSESQTISVVKVRKTYMLAGQPIAQRSYTRPASSSRNHNNGTENKLHFIYTDHLDSANTMVDESGNQSNTRYLPFGEIRGDESFEDGVGTVTERGFTGHRENRDIGLTYMNARYYVPGIGRFASADTIVPDPMNPQVFNRYSYSLNNPINLIDPSGHIAICFNGGPKNTGAYQEEEKAEHTVCEEALTQAGFDPENEKHGSIHRLQNGKEAIDEAVRLILEAEKNGEMIMLFGYSWGGAAALKTAQIVGRVEAGPVYSGAPIVPKTKDSTPIDMLILVDPEIHGRAAASTGLPKLFGYDRPLPTPWYIPRNVRYSTILHADAPTPYMGWSGLQDGTRILQPDTESTWKSVNGLLVDHKSIVAPPIQRATIAHLATEIEPIISSWNAEKIK